MKKFDAGDVFTGICYVILIIMGLFWCFYKSTIAAILLIIVSVCIIMYTIIDIIKTFKK